MLTLVLQMGVEQMSMKEAMKQMKEQTAQMALKAHQDAEAAAAEREAADSQLTQAREALEAEQNKVKSVEVCTACARPCHQRASCFLHALHIHARLTISTGFLQRFVIMTMLHSIKTQKECYLSKD